MSTYSEILHESLKECLMAREVTSLVCTISLGDSFVQELWVDLPEGVPGKLNSYSFESYDLLRVVVWNFSDHLEIAYWSSHIALASACVSFDTGFTYPSVQICS